MFTRVLSTDAVRSFCTLETKLSNTDSDIPLEFLLVHEPVELALEALYVATRSTHITVRLASTNRLWLIRFAEWPKGKGVRQLIRISARDTGSVNAWVFRTGQLCYLRNIDSRAEIVAYPGLQGTKTSKAAGDTRTEEYKSEYCIPIAVKNRVIGTVDLESSFIVAYADQTQLIKMISEQIALAFSKAQLSFEDQLFMILATTRLN